MCTYGLPDVLEAHAISGQQALNDAGIGDFDQRTRQMEPVCAQLPKKSQIEANVLSQMLNLKRQRAGIAPGCHYRKKPEVRDVSGHVEGLQADHAVAARKAHWSRVAAARAVLAPPPTFHRHRHGSIAQDFGV